MAASSQNRVIVVRNSREEPLLSSRPRLLSVQSPWNGIALERHTVRSVEVPEHSHNTLCMHLQLQGDVAMEWWSEGRSGIERLRAGSLMLLPEGTRDRLRWEGTSERLIVAIGTNLMKQAAEDAGLPEVPLIKTSWHMQNQGLQALLSAMGREAEAEWSAGPLYGQLLGLTLAQRLIRQHAASPQVLREERAAITLPTMRRVLEWVEESLHTEVRLEQMAAQAGLSEFHFARMFRQSTKLTPHQYVLNRRIDRARLLLRTGQQPIAEIAAGCGFSSATNFIRSFKARVGVTPGEYMRL